MRVEPFTVDVDANEIAELRRRLAATRWPDQVEGAGWDDGTDLSYLAELVAYWASDFDWWSQQAWLNSFPQHRATVGDGRLHFVHHRPTAQGAPPVVLLHGWPGGYVQMLPLLGELNDREIVLPSLPGFAFSDRPRRPGVGIRAMASMIHALMTGLGHDRYLVHGTDLGTLIAYEMAHAFPEHVLGVHVSAAVMPFILETPDDLSPQEEQFVATARIWMLTEMSYALQHSTKPQTLAYGLNDSPAALAAWLVEKFQGWSDCGDDLHRAVDRDELLTLLTVYWVTQTGSSSIRIYYEAVRDGGGRGAPHVRAPVIGPFTPSWSDVPVSVLTAPADLLPMPREWAERMVHVMRWTSLDRGGHFAEWEVPELVASDLRAFADALAARP